MANKNNGKLKIRGTNSRTLYLPFGTICWLKGDSGYSHIYTDETIYVVSHPLLYYEARLPTDFFRIHKQHIVARRAIRSLNNEYAHLLVLLQSGQELPVARLRRKAFLAWYSSAQ